MGDGSKPPPSSSADDTAQALSQFLETVDMGVDIHDVGTHRDTLEPQTPSELSSMGFTLGGLPVVALATEGVSEGDLRLRHTLGQGGMGEVWLADQVPLAREVAVKRLKPEIRGTDARRNILREAWITGRLEHPNIVPIHTLGLDVDGSPIMVMKRIEGTSWQDVLEDPDKMPARYKDVEVLAVHLQILMEVCDAVHFAHTRGVIHRDLKPDNVMLGAFGEIYLVDWGIAVSLEDDDGGRLPLAADVSAPAGTPVYMAPEMAEGKGARLGIHSDVFCLGAILHQIVTGEPRHKGLTFHSILMSAFASHPVEYDPRTVPRELATICNTATARDPADRHPSAEAFRADLQSFLRHRDSRRLAAQSSALLDSLKQAIEEDDRHRIHELYGACNFGFKQALEVWPENEVALGGQHTLLLRMARFELDRRQPETAAYMLGQIEGATPEVDAERQKIEAQIAVQRKEVEAMMALRHETSLRVFTRRRGLLAFVLGLGWAVNGFRRDAELPDHASLVTDQLIMIGVVVGILAVFRKWLLRTQVNRKLAMALVGVVVMDLAIRWAGWHLEIPILKLATLETVIDLAGILYIALLIDMRLLVAVAMMATASTLAIYNPERVYQIIAWSNLLTLLTISAIWFRKGPDALKASRPAESEPTDMHTPSSE